ncbi:MAG: MBOAT family protein [Leptospiraceae bacterium]|nr:MBOAT family protein [Leptospiraceae bacterium]
MVFSSVLFLVFFFPVFFTVYFLFPNYLKNLWALFASIVFYIWGGSDFFLILCASICVDFILMHIMDSKEGNFRLILALFSVIFNFCILGYFKYADFFVENWNFLLQKNFPLPKIILPIGISFFTFHKVSYTIDIYYKKSKPLKKISDYLLYILLFPQLIAGPIIRFNEIRDQILDRKNLENWDNRLKGLIRFCIGLARKVLIANVLGKEADKIFSLNEPELSFFLAWMGILAYTFQIYFDFAGYSDMALGLGKMMGFQFPENFQFPYTSGSITEFWRRWHITLGNWMRDYIYIPLGGNLVSKFQTYLNLWAVFLFSGLWHGASWNFVFWGAYHGLFISLEKFFKSPKEKEKKNFTKVLKVLFPSIKNISRLEISSGSAPTYSSCSLRTSIRRFLMRSSTFSPILSLTSTSGFPTFKSVTTFVLPLRFIKMFGSTGRSLVAFFPDLERILSFSMLFLAITLFGSIFTAS